MRRFTLSDQRTIRHAVIAGITAWVAALAVVIIGAAGKYPEYDAATGTARRPLVIVNGVTQQLPTTDYLSSPGGISTNGSAAGSGDVQTTTQTVSTVLTASGQFARPGSISPAAFTGTRVDNYNPTGLAGAFVIDQSCTSATTITGLAAQPTGTEIDFRNPISSTANITFSALDSNSLAANQFRLIGGATWIVPPGSSLLLRYNGSQWHVISLATTSYPALSAGSLNEGVITGSISSSVNDWNPTGLQTASIIQVDVLAQTNITGIAAPTGFVAGRKLCIEISANSSNSLTFIHQSPSSAAANRFVLVTGSSWQLITGNSTSICFFYDATASRWVQLASLTFPKLNVGSSSQFQVANTGAISGPTQSLVGFGSVQSATVSALSVVDPVTFTTGVTPMTSYGVNVSITSTRTSGTGALTNAALRGDASGGQVNNALVTDAGDVRLNQTSGRLMVGATPQIISTGTPTVDHGSVGTGSTNWVGNVTGVGSFSSVTLTFSAAFTNRSWCFVQPNSVTAPETIYVTNSASAPVFNCINTTTGAAANCNDFSYQCVGQ